MIPSIRDPMYNFVVAKLIFEGRPDKIHIA